MKKRFMSLCILLCLYLMCGCGTPLEEYQPQNEQEREVKAMLIDFAKSRNEFSVKGIASHLTEDCKVDIVGYSPVTSKAQYLSAWSDRDLENIGKAKFLDLNLNFIDDFVEAQTDASFSIFAAKFRIIFKIVQQDNHWIISEWTVTDETGF